MQISLTGFSQDMGFFVFAFECLGEDKMSGCTPRAPARLARVGMQWRSHNCKSSSLDRASARNEETNDDSHLRRPQLLVHSLVPAPSPAELAARTESTSIKRWVIVR